MYRVIKYFTDLQDDNHAYNEGDMYPRKGYKPSVERIEELATAKNVRHRPLITVVVSEKVLQDALEKADGEIVNIEAEDSTDDKPKKRSRK